MLEDRLADVERLRETGRRPALDAAQAQERVESLLAKPAAAVLRPEMLQQVPYLACRDRTRERHVEVRLPEVALVLRDLVLKDQVVAPGLPGDLGGDAMVLV